MRPDYLKYALDNVLHRKMRSWLTVISILIGITAIYALVSFGQGLSYYVDSLSSKMGNDKLIVQAKGVGAPGTDEIFNIKKNEIEFLSKVKGISQIVGMNAKSTEVEYNKQKKYVFGMSTPLGEEIKLFEEVMTVDIDKGRQLKKGDKLKAVLGYNYQFPDKIFDKAIKLGDKIRLNGKQVEVIGFYESIGNPQDDSYIYLTEEGFLLLHPKTKDEFQFVMARAEPNVDPTALAEKAEDKLRKFKGQKKGKEDFYIQTFEQAIETFSNVLLVINGILVLIALISLFVAGVNIMNTMYTAVLERTKEIGIMKAIGARNSDIRGIFLFESGLLGLVGGMFGVIAGYGAAKLGGGIATASGYSFLQPIFPWQLTAGCLLFAFFVGALAGLFPAHQASKLHPVDALRYE